MKNIIKILLLLFTSCNCLTESDVAYQISEKDLIPEGIAYSSTKNSFYLSSIWKTKIVQIDAVTGDYKDFIPSELLGLRFLGLMVDDAKNCLWACGNITKDKQRFSSICKFDLLTGKLIKSYLRIDTIPFTYNDLTLDTEGNIYATNWDRHTIYKIDNLNDSIGLFFKGEEIFHPNGITISPNNKYLFIASGEKGIRILDIKNREVVGKPDTIFNSKGIDGLKYYKNSLIGIQNGVVDVSEIKINRYYLDETGVKINKMEVIDQNNTLFDIPTTCVINKDYLYCIANSQLGNITYPNIQIINPEKLNDILILKYKL